MVTRSKGMQVMTYEGQQVCAVKSQGKVLTYMRHLDAMHPFANAYVLQSCSNILMLHDKEGSS